MEGKYFKRAELTCRCGCGMDVKKELVDKLDSLRLEFGAPIRVTSAARCQAHNVRIGGHPNSSHTRGEAADLTAGDLDRLYALCEKHFKAVGDARSGKRFIHVDLRSDKVRRWNY